MSSLSHINQLNIFEVQAEESTPKLEEEFNPVIQEIRDLDFQLEDYYKEKIKIYPEFILNPDDYT